MILADGTRLGPYEILAPLGAGGMGEVYKARDTRLGRTVAIKVLPDGGASDPDRRRRFEQEARAVSALDHPHICVLHDIGCEIPVPAATGAGTSSGSPGHPARVPFLVMEHLEGETLASRLRRGPLTPARALELATQIADALAAAHGHGIVHRDLKPGNIMVTRGRAASPDSGHAKLLDFGLARLKGPVAPAESSAPSTLEPATRPGTVLGTIPYMAPEQLEGKEADPRTDFFAFGSVLYEMLTGQRAFGGESEASVIAAIMTSDPIPVRTLQPLAPKALERLVAKCLQKPPDARWQSAVDLADELRWLSGAGSGASEPSPTRTSSAVRRRFVLAAVAVAVTAVVIAAATAVWRWQTATLSAPKASMRLSVTLPPEMPLAPAGLVSPGHDRLALALSPDGSRLAYVALVGDRTLICVRDMRTGSVKPLEHTAGAHTPFFSPDGDWIGFAADHKLKKMSVDGGDAVELVEAPESWGATWGSDGRIYFNRHEGEGIFSVAAGGGPVQAVVEGIAFTPELVGHGPGLLVSAPGVRYVELGKPAASKQLLEGTRARYVASDHIVYTSGSKLMAVPFDASRVETTGPPVVLAEDLRTAHYSVAQFALSDEGTLVYAPGTPQGMASFVWVDRRGRTTPIGLPEANYEAFALSPDGTRLAYGLGGVIYVYDFTRRTSSRFTPRITTGDSIPSMFPRWTPDGNAILYRSRPNDAPSQLMVASADGSTPPTPVWTAGLTGPSSLYPTGLSADGSVLIVFGPSKATSYDLFRMHVSGSGRSLVMKQLEALLEEPFAQVFGWVSRDERWMLYMSDQSGQPEAYVTSYPTPGRVWQVSKNGGREPMWNPAAPEIVYVDGMSMYSVPVTLGQEFRHGEPRLLFQGAYPDSLGCGYDMTPDGQRFLMLENKDVLKPTTTLTVITNVLDEVRQRVPTEKR